MPTAPVVGTVTVSWALAAMALLPLLAAGARRAIGWTIGGALLILLGVASALMNWATLAFAPPSFLAMSGGFVWLGLGLQAFGVWTSSRAKEEFTLRALGPVGANLCITVAALIAAFVIYSVWPLLYLASWRAPIAALGLAGSGIFLATLLDLIRVKRGITFLDERWLARKWTPWPCLEAHGRLAFLATAVLSVVVAAWSANLLLGVGAVLAASVATHRLAREEGIVPWFPVQPVIAGVALLVFTWFVTTIAGSDIPWSLPGLLEAPFSETAEAMLALFLGLGVWVLLGLWPFHGLGPGTVLAFLGGVLLARWGGELIPSGIGHALPIFALVAALAALHAAATGRVGEYIAALGVLAVDSGTGATMVFGALASAVAVARLMKAPSPIRGIDRRELAGVVLIPVLAWALPTMLLGETVLTVVTMLAGVALFRPVDQVA